jgi:hypothetical protein
VVKLMTFNGGVFVVKLMTFRCSIVFGGHEEAQV